MAQHETGIRSLLALPRAYDLFQNLVGAAELRRRFVREILKPFPGARVLDIGCGTAELLGFLPREIEYTGYDMSPAYIEAAQARFGDRGTFLCEPVRSGTGDSAPYGEEQYDIALAFGVLHHLDDAEGKQLFASARSALKPTGRVVTIDPAFVPGQSAAARYFVSRDRGRNVRTPEGFAALAAGSFARVDSVHWHGALRIPYDHAVVAAVP